MEILFLGTSAGWPLPRLGCNCPICTSNDPKDKRLRPSILINRSVLIDAGPDFYHQIKKILSEPGNHTLCEKSKGVLRTFNNKKPTKVHFSPRNLHTGCEGSGERNIKFIFISHIHPDHYFGLWDVAKIYGKKPAVFLSAKNKKILSRRLNDATINSVLQQAETFSHGKKIKLNQLAPSNKNLSITPFFVNHSTNTETFGFLVKEKASQGNTSEVLRSNSSDGEGIGERRALKSKTKTLIYIPDFRQIPQTSLKYLKNADLAILDGSNFEPAGPARWGHISMRESIKLAKRLKIKEVFYTHIGHGPKMDIHKQLEEKVQKTASKKFHIAYDGLSIRV